MNHLLSIDDESDSFKLALNEFMANADTHIEVNNILNPLLLSPQLDQAVYLLRVIQLMDMSHRLVCMQRKLTDIMVENSCCEDNRPVLAQAIYTLDHTIACYMEGCFQCPEFLN